MDSKVVRADFGSGLICPRAQTCMDSKVVRADFGSGLICPRAQTCMDSKVVRADFGSGLICPRTQTCMDSKVVREDFGSGLIRPRAQTCMDSKVVRADFGSGLICPRAQTCCASPTQTPARLANSPGFKSSRCPLWRIKFSLERFSDSVANLFASPAVGKFSRASSAGGRRNLQLNFVNQIVSVAEDCLSPERTFHGCSLMHFRGCFRG